jgi:hypothetical protein
VGRKQEKGKREGGMKKEEKQRKENQIIGDTGLDTFYKK